MVRLIILDVEGVIALPGGSQHPWPLEEMLRIRGVLRELPVPCVLCTGRQEPYGEAVIQALNLFYPMPDAVRERVVEHGGPALLSWPSVLENGGYFYDPMAKTPFPHPDLTPERVLRLHRLRAEILQPLADRTGAIVEAGKDFSVSINPPPATPGSRERQTTDSFRPLVDQALREHLAEVEIKHSLSSVDITPAGISKASAVRHLMEWTGLHSDEVLGVGDTKADEAWLAEVGWRAAPANGREALPGMSYYSPYEVAAGLRDILERLRDRCCEGL